MAVKSGKVKSKAVKYLYEFGPFRLDSSDLQLLRDGTALSLTPKAIETLLVLVQNSGQTVDKDELMKTVWPDTIVEENNLTQSVSALRKALGPDCPYIETVPRQGYRFTALVKERREEIPQLIVRERTRQIVTIEEEPEVAREIAVGQVTDIGVPPAVLPQPHRVAPYLAVSATVMVGILALAIYSVRHGKFPAISETNSDRLGIPPLSQGKYVTVMPFQALGDQASLRYLTEGLSEALTARLFRFNQLHVIDCDTGEKGRTGVPLESVGRDLGVNLVVAGMVQEAGEKVQAVVSVEDVADKKKIWTQEFSAARKDLLPLQDQIFDGLVAGLGLKPNPEELARNVVNPTTDSGAYDLYLKGRDALRAYKDAKDIDAAIGFYQDALSKDPRFALAYAGLADASLEMYGQKKDNFWAEKAQHAASQSLSLDRNLVEAHLAMGSFFYASGETTKSIGEFKTALTLNPNSGEGHRRLGSAYAANNQAKEAAQEYQKAIEIRPYYLQNYQMLGDMYLDMGSNDEALNAYRRITELEPTNSEGFEDLGAVYLREAKWQDSIAEFQKALALQPYFQTYSNLGTDYFFLKQYPEAVRMFEKAVELNPNEEEIVGNLADAYRWSGNKGKAAAAYDRAIELATKELQVNPRDPNVLGSLALYEAKKGNSKKGLGLIRQARTYDRTNVGLVYIEAVVQTLAGNSTEGLRNLREALQKGYAPLEARNDPELVALRSNPDFGKLMQQFGSKSN